MVFKKNQPEGAPDTNKSGAGAVISLSPEDELMVSEYAQQHGVNRAEAVRKLLFFAQATKDQTPKPTILSKSMQVIRDAQEIGMAGSDPNDALNVMGRSVAIQTLGKELMSGGKGGAGKATIEDIKELMYLKILERMAGGSSDESSSSVIQEIRAENEKQRQFYEGKLKEQDEKIKEMVFEKRQQTTEQSIANIGQQIQDLNETVSLYRNAPPTASTEDKKDAIAHLQQASGEIRKLKDVMVELGMIPATSTPAPSLGTPGKEVWRNQDGSTNKWMYFLDRIAGAAEKGIDAWEKKTPEFEGIEKSPADKAPSQQTAQNSDLINVTFSDMMKPEDYFAFLMTKTSLTSEEQQWLNANAHRFVPKPAKRAPPQPPPEPEPNNKQVLCSKCLTNPAGDDGLCEQCREEANMMPQ